MKITNSKKICEKKYKKIGNNTYCIRFALWWNKVIATEINVALETTSGHLPTVGMVVSLSTNDGQRFW